MGVVVTISASPATVSAPTGSVDIRLNETTIFTVPAGIIILRVELPPNHSGVTSTRYVGVTPKSDYTAQLIGYYNGATFPPFFYLLKCNTHNDIPYGLNRFPWEVNNMFARISWSPIINKHKPDIFDY